MAGNLLPLVLIGGVAVLLSKKKKKKKGGCQAQIGIAVDSIAVETITAPMPGLEDGVEYKITKSMFDDYNSGSRDIVAMTKKVLLPFIPEECMGSRSVKVRFYSDRGEFVDRAPVVFLGIGTGFIEDMIDAGLMDEDTGRPMSGAMVQWWAVNTQGEALPNIG